MEISEALAFLRENHRAILATTRADGSPQLSPVGAAVDADGFVVVSSRETAVKTKNLRRNARAVLCVVTDAWYGPWVQVGGTATILSLPDAMEPLVEYYRSVAGEHPDWDDYRAAMVREKRVLIRIAVDAAGPSVSG